MKFAARILALMFALVATSAWACPGDKAKDDGKQTTPKKPTTSLSID